MFQALNKRPTALQLMTPMVRQQKNPTVHCSAPAEEYAAPADDSYGAPAEESYSSPADDSYGAQAEESYSAPAEDSYSQQNTLLIDYTT